MLEPIPFLGWFNWFEDPEPLTDLRILEIWNNSYRKSLEDYDIFAFARAIEEHHGIK